ncbi:MAG: hypothetical protein ACE5PV_20590 [Candidatus Poribacteria bacterium]
MNDVNWGNYAEAYKAIHDKLDEILTKLDYPTDPAIQDVIDRANRLLGRVYGSKGQPLAQESVSPYPLLTSTYGSKGQIIQQRASTYDLLVQLRHQGTEIDPRKITDVTKIVTQKKIDLTATGVIHAPASGKKIRLKGFAWSSNADIITALRFGTTGDLLFPIQAKGVIGMNLVGCNVEGAVDEALYGYLSGSGTMKGTVLIEEI